MTDPDHASLANNISEGRMAKMHDRMVSLERQRAGLVGAAERYREEVERLKSNNKLGQVELAKLHRIIDRMVDAIEKLRIVPEDEWHRKIILGYVKTMLSHEGGMKK